MKIEVLFTLSMDNWEQGAKHLTDGGIWFRQFIDEKGNKKAHLYCLDKLVLADLADGFGLTKFDRDVELYGHGYYLKTFRIVVWGKKLEKILEWRREILQQNSKGT